MPHTWASRPTGEIPGPVAAATAGHVATVSAPSHSAVRAVYRSTARGLVGRSGACGGGVRCNGRGGDHRVSVPGLTVIVRLPGGGRGHPVVTRRGPQARP